MPSQLSSPRTDIRRSNLQRATQLQYLQTLSNRGPFAGIIPDIDPNQLPGNAALYMENLRARPTPGGHGELLMLPPGYSRVDPDRLPLGQTDVGPPIVEYRTISMLGQLVRATNTTGERAGEFEITPLALTVGDGAGAGAANFDSILYRINPTTNQWEQITYSVVGASPADQELRADRDNSSGNSPGLPTMCTFSAGAPVVDGVTRGYSGAVNQPVAIITDNLSPVQIYPRTDGAVHTHYENLTDNFGAGQFLAKSCASWNDRVYFLNTSESGNRYSQRIRRTARGTANPDPAIVGSGATDLDEFSRDGLRLEPLGELLACYFEDGVAFLHKTGIVTTPDQIQIVTKDRGLLSGHGLCNIGGNEHFGIFNDGWWIINEEGQWREVGLSQVQNTPMRKWSNYFYQNLDYDNRQRIYCYYIKDFKQVAIIYPRNGQADELETEIWILDLQSERVFIDKYNATVFGAFDLQTVQDITYDDFGGAPDTPVDGVLTYEEAGAAGWTYDSIGPKFAMEGLVHGTTDGLVFAHTTENSRRDGSYAFTWLWESHPRSQGATRYQLTADRIVVEYIRQLGVSADVTVFSGSLTSEIPAREQVRVLNMTEGSPGDVRSARTYFRFSAASMGLRLSGTGPVMIRGWDFDLFSPQVESLR